MNFDKEDKTNILKGTSMFLVIIFHPFGDRVKEYRSIIPILFDWVNHGVALRHKTMAPIGHMLNNIQKENKEKIADQAWNALNHIEHFAKSLDCYCPIKSNISGIEKWQVSISAFLQFFVEVKFLWICC